MEKHVPNFETKEVIINKFIQNWKREEKRKQRQDD